MRFKTAHIEEDSNRIYRLDGVVRIAGGMNEKGTDEVTVRRYARAYIMMLLSTQLYGDKSGTRLHICWLPYVARLEDMGRYSWGSAALSWLYRCMCRVDNRNVIKLAGPL
ncbi:hypothetical protein Ahy_B01g056327 [Arachis hypogaea]|uniref:Aminotransferase-like plant mobile domain-containing protein n=1 Tax=Arachis hypogaea TaxID=3818 RepID=A0A445AYN8_ARAHY|nr:hypothetical protein Ahy_B01g056327 [Arachis hypogaea]